MCNLIVHIREISDIRQKVEYGANSKTERTGNLESADWVFDIVEDIIDVGPSSISIQDLEGCGGVLRRMSRTLRS